MANGWARFHFPVHGSVFFVAEVIVKVFTADKRNWIAMPYEVYGVFIFGIFEHLLGADCENY